MATVAILRLPAVKSRTGLSRSSIYAAMSRGEFPAPIKLVAGARARAVGWPESSIDSYLAARISQGRQMAPKAE
jgi:prophage regulatory protein